jgi:zeta-carotene desaturase
LCKWLWHPVAVAALNQQPERAAARPFARVLGELFASDPAAAAISLPSVPLDDLFAAPAASFIEARGGAAFRRTTGRVAIDSSGKLIGVRVGPGLIEAPLVISAVPWHAFERLFEAGAPRPLSELARTAAGFQSSPIVTVNLWLDADTSELDRLLPPALGLVEGPMHWVFHRGRISGAPTKHLSIVSSGADDILRHENDALAGEAFAQLQSAVPGLRGRRIRHSVVVREPRATFSLAPGSPIRPGPITPVAGLLLAGDWTDTGLPATIEGAVRSGYRAAELAGVK